MSDDLIAFMRAQLDEDERVAREADPAWHRRIVSELADRALYGIHKQVRHLAVWEPGRVLAEVDAKRQVMDLHPTVPEDWATDIAGDCRTCSEPAPCKTVRVLALPYADRPGYREEWRP